MALLLLLACAPAERADTGPACHEWEEVVELSVASETSPCPPLEDVGVDDVARYQGCDGDELVMVVEAVSETPSACGGWRACSWACTYRARIRSCAAAPTGCWIS